MHALSIGGDVPEVRGSETGVGFFDAWVGEGGGVSTVRLEDVIEKQEDQR